MLRFRSRSVADLGDGPGPQLFWVKKEEMTVGKKASSASKSKPSRVARGRVVSGTRDHITGALDVVSWPATSVVFPVRQRIP